jgi:hypothetical protein
MTDADLGDGEVPCDVVVHVLDLIAEDSLSNPHDS